MTAPNPVSEALLRAQSALGAGQIEEGYAALAAVLRHDPTERNALYNTAVIDGRRGDWTRAARGFRRTVLSDPAHAAALGSLTAVSGHGAPGSAGETSPSQIRLAARPTVLAPDNPAHWRRLAEALDAHNGSMTGTLTLTLTPTPRGSAIEAWRRAVILGLADGGTLAAAARPLRARNPATARAMILTALHGPSAARLPEAVQAACWSQLAELDQSRGRPQAAVRAHKRCACLDPARADILANLAAAHQDASAPGETHRVLSRARAADPSDRHVRWLLGCRAMARHQFEAAAPLLAARWTDPEPGSRAAREQAPLWTGDRLGRRSIRLWPDFNIGDEILFANVVPDVTGVGPAPKRRVILEAAPRLGALFGRSFPNAEVVAAPANRDEPASPEADTDLQASTALAACWLRRRIPQFPDTQGYLKADPDRTQRYRDILTAGGTERLVGLGWTSGNRRTAAGKATRLIDWAVLLGMPGVRVVSLQYDPPEDEIAAVREVGLPVPETPPLDDLRDDIDGLAALIGAMDVVVSISGLTAHLAGALGRPGHVLLPPAPLWFWFDRGRRTPWYPSLTLHRRAPEEADWRRPIAEIATAIGA